MEKIAILGAGTWGITLARLLSRAGREVTVWSALAEEIETLQSTGVHPKLPEAKLPPELRYTASLEEALHGRHYVIFAVPSVYLRATARAAKTLLSSDTVLISVVKGLESDTLFTMSEILGDEIGDAHPIVALSGPTHAEEVALDLPTAAVVACRDGRIAAEVQMLMGTDCFRLYTNGDIRGVELCGAVKNIMALAAGMSHGLGYGDNARAALVTRGIAELSRLGEAMGCDPQTFFGLAGIGDLVVTAGSMHSRNFRCGTLIGQGVAVDDAVRQIGMVVEGLNALDGALRLMEKYGVDMPIVKAVGEIVHHGADPREMVNRLMGRTLKKEF